MRCCSVFIPSRAQRFMPLQFYLRSKIIYYILLIITFYQSLSVA